MLADYDTFQGWEYKRKLAQGYSEKDIQEYPTFERLESMKEWVAMGKPL